MSIYIGKWQHIGSYLAVSKREHQEWPNSIEVVVGCFQGTWITFHTERQTDIYCSVLQSCLVWGQGTLACSILFTVHYMT